MKIIEDADDLPGARSDQFKITLDSGWYNPYHTLTVTHTEIDYMIFETKETLEQFHKMQNQNDEEKLQEIINKLNE
jgi:hypothetical protein